MLKSLEDYRIASALSSSRNVYHHHYQSSNYSRRILESMARVPSKHGLDQVTL